jgi:hypothetical protein
VNEVIIWATFLGAWLLVAGPLFQGVVELNELEFDREGFEGIKASAVQAAPDQPSPWWWLVPPVAYVLHRRWAREFRDVSFARLTPAQREQLASFRSKSTGWFTVAAGATLLAAGETWHVTEDYEWPVWAFWLLTAAMLALAVLNTAVWRNHSEHADRRAAAADPVPPAVDMP